MKIIEAIRYLEKQGFNFKEDKAIFRLEEGALEIYFDEDEEMLKAKLHDLKVFVSDELNDKVFIDVTTVLAGIYKEDK